MRTSSNRNVDRKQEQKFDSLIDNMSKSITEYADEVESNKVEEDELLDNLTSSINAYADKVSEDSLEENEGVLEDFEEGVIDNLVSLNREIDMAILEEKIQEETLVEGYLELLKGLGKLSVDSGNSIEDLGNTSEEENKGKESKDNVDGSDSKKKIPVKPILIVSGIVVVIVLVFTLGYKSVRVSKISSISEIRTDVDSLYSSAKKDKLKRSTDEDDVNLYRKALSNVDAENSEKEILLNELNTIDYYLEDFELVKEIGDYSYDFNSSDMETNIEELKESVNNYSIPGLALSISNKVSKIESDYNYFVGLRDELSVIEDYLNYDKEGYQIKVNKVTHEVNKKELQSMVDELSKAKKNAEEIEALKDKADEESKKKIEELQSETEKALNETKEELNSYKEEAKGFFDKILEKLNIGNSDSDESNE